MTSPLLCLLLACCVGWPAPAWAWRPVVDAWPTPARAQELHPSRFAFQQAAHPGSDDGGAVMSAPSEFDDAEDPDDLGPLKRGSPGADLGRSEFARFPTGSALGLPISRTCRPHPAPFRNQPIRC